MNDPPDPFTSVSSAWLLGSASNCGSVWFTVRKRWKRSANNRLGKLEISSSGGEEWRGGGDSFLIRGREIGSRNLERIPSTRFIYANSYVWLFPADDWPASNPILAPRHELRLLSMVSCGIAVWMESRRNQLLTEKEKKELITGWVHDPIRNVVSWLALSMNLDVGSIRGGSLRIGFVREETRHSWNTIIPLFW